MDLWRKINGRKIYRIGRYDKNSSGKFTLREEFTTDSPYWKVIDNKIYYVFGTGKHGIDYKEKLTEMNMSKEDALKNDCHCYYQILESCQ